MNSTNGAKGKRVLVIEDDESLIYLLKMQLEAKGFEVHTETCGAMALSYATDHSLDLVILDLMLPDISGFQVCKELRRIYNPWAPPILMLTGLNQPIDQLLGFAHGADAYLTKPYEPAELLKTIGQLCE